MRERLRTAAIYLGCLALFKVMKRLLTATLSHVVASTGQLLASDINGIIDQTNTDASNITTLQGQMTTANSNVSTLQSQMTTANSNISTLQGAPTFSGKISTQGVNFITGSISRTSIFTGSASSAGNTQAHGLGATPDFCMFQQTGAAGDANTFQWDKAAIDGTNVKGWTGNASAPNYRH